jgi:hypothetical protein
MLLLRIVAFPIGLAIVVATLLSAIRTLVLSRGSRDALTSYVFIAVRWLFRARLRWLHTYAERDRLLAYYAPLSLMVLPTFWLSLVLIGFMVMFWATGVPTWEKAFTVSGSSLLTLGFARSDTLLHTIMAFFEATIGLILIAILIAYLPAMYNAYSLREKRVTLLEVRAGKPPSGVEMLLRYHRNNGFNSMSESWIMWETWFAELQESHTSLAAIVYFRSPQADQSWVNAAGAVLDAAALSLSTIDIPWDAQAALCIRSGYLALRRIADFYLVEYNDDPSFPDDPISIAQEEFDEVYDRFVEAGVPLKADRETAWLDYAGWRVNYDIPLVALSTITLAPEAPWTSDRKHEKSARWE